MSGEANERHRIAQATAALCVGGMVVARAMDDRKLADELRDACMNVGLTLGGWEAEEAAKNGRRQMVETRV
jgi:TetR/AcrR family transcriptional repressor of nem operon